MQQGTTPGTELDGPQRTGQKLYLALLERAPDPAPTRWLAQCLCASLLSCQINLKDSGAFGWRLPAVDTDLGQLAVLQAGDRQDYLDSCKSSRSKNLITVDEKALWEKKIQQRPKIIC